MHGRFVANHYLSNLRILLTFIGTMLAVVAQFYPPGKVWRRRWRFVLVLFASSAHDGLDGWQYPQNFAALIVCCPAYFVVNMVVTYWLPRQEQDIVGATYGSKGTRALQLRSELDVNEHMYEVRVVDAENQVSSQPRVCFSSCSHA